MSAHPQSDGLSLGRQVQMGFFSRKILLGIHTIQILLSSTRSYGGDFPKIVLVEMETICILDPNIQNSYFTLSNDEAPENYVEN